jgi:hypothetical protein
MYKNSPKKMKKQQQTMRGKTPIVDADGTSARGIRSALRADQAWKLESCRFPGIGFPDQLKCVLKYKENGISFTASPTPAAQVYRINSLFDPNLTGTGHQPSYFDQLAAVYGQYCVVASRMKCQIFNEGTVEVTAALVYSDVNTSTQTVENLEEARWSRSAQLGIQNSGSSVRDLDGGVILLPTLMGEKDLNTDPNQYANVTTNPVDVGFGIFKIAAVDGITNVKAIVNFELEFDIIFKELTPIAES